MRILILTQYFPPEVGAPQNRLFGTAIRLKEKGIEVSILTAMPNYPQMRIYKGYRGRWYVHERLDGLSVHRAYVFARPTRSIFLRLLNYFSFVFSSCLIGWQKVPRVDLILCESPPLFLGISACFLKKAKHAKLVFNVSDLWPESAEQLGLVRNRFLLRLATWLEEFVYRQSELITGQTQGIVNDIKQRMPERRVEWIPNGVDLSLYDDCVKKQEEHCDSGAKVTWKEMHGFSADDFVFLYAGIIGHAQGLEVIVKAARLLAAYPNIKMVLLGEGPEKENLLKLKTEIRADNLCFFEAIPKNKMLEVLQSIDATIVPLKRIALFKGAIPSKIFESLAMKKPILLGLEGEAKELFIDQGRCGLAFTPEDDEDLANKALMLYNDRELLKSLGDNGYRYVNENFDRDKIVDKLYALLESIH